MDVSQYSAVEVKPEENRASDPNSSLRHWLAAVDAVLRAIQETVWRLRRETLDAYQDWAGGVRDAQSALASWPERTQALGDKLDSLLRPVIAPPSSALCTSSTE